MTVIPNRESAYKVVESAIETVGGVQTHYWEYVPDNPIGDVVVYVGGGWPVDSTWLSDIYEGLVAAGVPVVRYDMRGTGASGRPWRLKRYSMPEHARELDAVIDATAAGRKVVLLGEAWGVFMGAEHAHMFPGKIDTLYSVGVPSVDMAFSALRRSTRRAFRQGSGRIRAVRQWAFLWYWYLTALPVLPELVFATGLPSAGIGRMLTQGDRRYGRPHAEPFHITRSDVHKGSLKYRWFVRHRMFTPAYDALPVAHVYLFQPDGDNMSGPLLLDGLAERTPDLHITHLDGNHTNFRYGEPGAAIQKQILATITG